MKITLIIVFLTSFVLINGQEKLFHKGQKGVNELEAVTKIIGFKIDSLRAKKKLEGLEVDLYLIEAAQMHADWMLEKDKLSHVQNKLSTKTPQKRVALVGGNDSFIGENIAFTLFDIELTDKKGKRYINKTYEAVASDLVEMWQKSKGHYKNIITKGFSTTGIALSIDYKQNKIYAVQVFGTK